MEKCDIVTYGNVHCLRGKQVYVRGMIADKYFWLSHNGVWCDWLETTRKDECIFSSRHAAFKTLKRSLGQDKMTVSFVDGDEGW